MSANRENTIPLSVPFLQGNESKYLEECIQTNFVSSIGPFVARFEELISKATQASHAVSTCSGTSALHVTLRALGVSPGDIVITPSFTFIATANAISYCGAEPWLFDVSPEIWGLDENLLKKTLEAETTCSNGSLIHKILGKRIAAILPVFALGIPYCLKNLRKIADSYNLPILLDAAGALGSKVGEQEIGQLPVDASILSFNGNKIITSGGGGCVLTNDQKLAQNIRHLSSTARLGTDYTHDKVAYNYRITNLEAAVGLAQLEKLSDFVDKKKKIATFYGQLVKRLSNVDTFPVPPQSEKNCWLSGLVLPNADQVNKLIQYLEKNNIQARHFWKPLHKNPPYEKALQTAQTYIDSLYERVIILPSSTGLSDDEMMRIRTALLDFFEVTHT